MEDSLENIDSLVHSEPEIANDSTDLEQLQERESSHISERSYWELENYQY